ncbi:hypothetical protein VM1G_04841 [Cytospora mali]|uniref:FAS1 domain-containing protein n=1 Tax=Cytospora mali TaxID=578113 RepID=A0A194W151_CYTMA|nr:hypothetical protein VM1G_04841 [Valsa mali]
MLETSQIRTALGALVSLLSCLSVVAQSGLLNDLDHVLSGRQDLSTFRDMLSRYPHVLLDLPNYAGVTIVAPNNDAFEKNRDWDPDNRDMMTDILTYHMLQGTVSTKAIQIGIPVYAPTLLKDSASTNITGGQRVIIHSQSNEEIVFTSGADLRSTVVEGDIQFSDGMLHIVDTMLVPPMRLEPTCRIYYPILRAFLAALYRTGLIDQFANTRDVTIFAPWDTAFQLTSGALSTLQPSELKDILTYHIIPGQVLYSPDLSNATTWPTLSQVKGATGPANVTVTFAGNNRYIDSSQILHADILIANGVVHMMENVLNPDQADVRPNLDWYTQTPVFSLTGATATGTKVPVPFTEALPCTANCSVTPTVTTTTPTDITNYFSTNGVAGSGLLPKCTGIVGVIGMGVFGAGMIGVAGVL